MKRIYTFVLLLAFSSTLKAQLFTPILKETYKLPAPSGMPSVLTVDSLTEYIDRASGATLYSAQGGGYVFGTSYDSAGGSSLVPITAEIAMHYDGVANASVTEIIFWAGVAVVNGTAENVSGNVYTADVDSMPNSLLGSNSISMNDVLPGNMLSFTSILITPPAPTNGNPFLVSVGYAGNDDTLGLVTTALGDGLNEKRVRMLADASVGGGWKRMGELYGFLDLDAIIVPIVDIAQGISDHFVINETSLKPIFPAPAKDQINIDYTLANAADISYRLFDNSGRVVYESSKGKISSGHYAETIDVSKCAAGKYFFTFVSNHSPVTQKVMIVK
jgi:hypothetical protein